MKKMSCNFISLPYAASRFIFGRILVDRLLDATFPFRNKIT